MYAGNIMQYKFAMTLYTGNIMQYKIIWNTYYCVSGPLHEGNHLKSEPKLNQSEPV